MALYEHLIETFGDAETAREWLHSPSRYLGRVKPIDAIRTGCLAENEAALEAFESGVSI
ncbi:MAG: DUF2384 domain-containing protein [Chloroflexi bacterium]|nr:DUF2384 domain-containing protein [Chloroflexota bacterium]